MVANNNGHAIKAFSLESKLALNHTAAASKSHNDVLVNPNSSTVEYVNGEEIGEPVQHVVTEPKRAAKIHDFCFGIPYGECLFLLVDYLLQQLFTVYIYHLAAGGIVLSGGLVGFILSRNPATLINGGLYGGGLLALSILSLKIWRQGQSSLPFILGQAGIAAALLWKNVQTYALTKKILPTGFHAVLSAAMLCFYTYVMLSGGNPPPKKLKSSAAS
ncbi:hypothetical protein OSB04_023570 [Centaurea solstitialis]|uniref:Uncharacterized protein n=1 Tax=Centaurea solstitialis TaxID=347529 RepID=A0AA38T429_9ASTR|nr:hypothetical protein OSB04_023570 [Centaurea solstitialis]